MRGENKPVRERRCIFVGVCFELDVFGPDMFGGDVLEQGDFESGIIDIIVTAVRLARWTEETKRKVK